MTPEQLAEIEQRAGAATPGPWEPGHFWLEAGTIFDAERNRVGKGGTHCACCHHGPPVWTGILDINGTRMPAHRHRCAEPTDPDHQVSGPEGAVITGNYDYGAGGVLKAADTRFIAHARTDVPALVAEVKQLTAERDSLKGLLCGSQTELRDAVAAWGKAERDRDEALAAIDRVRALRGRCEQGARDNGEYYNNRTGEPAKYELGKAAVYDYVATELREVLAALDGSGT